MKWLLAIADFCTFPFFVRVISRTPRRPRTRRPFPRSIAGEEARNNGGRGRKGTGLAFVRQKREMHTCARGSSGQPTVGTDGDAAGGSAGAQV